MATLISSHLLLPLLLLCVVFVSEREVAAAGGGGKNSSLQYPRRPPALFVFGDSTVDTGNNNYIKTVLKCNFPPYGRDFRGQEATGRFSNGRLSIDYIASYMGIKEYMPPYLDPNLSLQELMTGVIFASAASGMDPLTAKLSNVIPMPQQLHHFKEYKRRIADQVGRDRMEQLIKNSVFLVSAGTNDFAVNYFPFPFRKNFTIPEYEQFVLEKATDFIQALKDEGVRRLIVIGLPPIGCLPVVISLYSFNLSRPCLDRYSSVARDYNSLLQKQLTKIMQEQTNPGLLKLYYADIYGPLLHMIQNRQQYGFDEVNIGCCGTGRLELSSACNLTISSCPDATKHIFWDAIHPTEQASYYIFLSMRRVIDSALMGL